MPENLKVFRVNSHSSIMIYEVCECNKYHWKIEYHTVFGNVTDTIKSDCDGSCKGKKCLGMHQFIRNAIKRHEFLLNLVPKSSKSRKRK